MVHITREILEAVRSGALSRDAFYSMVLHHLLGSCEACREAIEGTLDEWAGEAFVPELSVTDWAAAKEREHDAGVPAAETELAELLAEGDQQRRLDKVLRARSRFRSPILVTLLLERARQLLSSQPGVACDLAQLAEQVALRVPTVGERRGLGVDLLIEARAHLANSLRVAGRLREAAALHANVEKLLATSADPLLHAEVASFGGSLAKDQRRFAAAERAMERALLLYRHLDETGAVGRVLVQKSILLHHQGRTEEALELVREAVEHLDPEVNERLWLCGQHNVAWYLVELGRPEEARQVMLQSLPFYRRFQGCASQLRLLWLEGKIAEALGDPEAAEAAYERVQQGFLERGLGYDAALVMLDRAGLALGQGDLPAVQRLSREAMPLFEAQEIHPEAFTALLLFTRAAAAQAVTLDQIQRLTIYLREVRSNPALRAEEAS